jgi:predicted dehydrogenase
MIRLGVIGLSEGNGHPYSWSAICNGYDPEAMARCPFPVIPKYLAERTFPDDQLPDVQVSHIWTEDPAVSRDVAAAARITHVVERLDDLVGQVDGVLLARDDAERHVEMAVPLLQAGLPVYVDKPVALSQTDLEALYAATQYEGQLFSCSALRYSPSIRLDEASRARIGDVRHVEGVVPKYWRTYAVHLVDPLLASLGLYGAPCEVRACRGDVHVAHLRFPSATATLTCTGGLPGELKLRYYGERGYVDRPFTDTFVSFRTALAMFVDGVQRGVAHTTREELTSVVRILEGGLRAE